MINRITLLLFIGLAFAQDITIAVLEFDGKGVSQSEASTLTDRLRDELFKTGIYIGIERGKMVEVIKEQGFQQSGCTTSECAVEVGNLLGANQMVAGSIGKVGNVYTVSARIIDVKTGKVLKSANYDHLGGIEQLLMNGMRKVSLTLVGVNTSYNDDSEKIKNTQSYKVPPPRYMMGSFGWGLSISMTSALTYSLAFVSDLQDPELGMLTLELQRNCAIGFVTGLIMMRIGYEEHQAEMEKFKDYKKTLN